MATNKNFIVKNGLDVSGTANLSTLNLTGSLTGPATFTIDPAAIGDNTGTVVIAGNLQVDGTQTTINSTTMTVDDLNLTLASGAANAAAANGAGLTVDGSSATLLYANSDDSWAVNKRFKAQSDIRLGSDGVRLSTDGNGEFGVGYGQTATNNRFTVYNNTTAALRVLPNGNVGIGTTNPGAKLHVQSTGSDGVIVRTTTNAEPFIALQRNSGSNGVAVLRSIDGGDLRIDTGATGAAQSTKMTIEAGGNVGIGTTDPSTTLHVDSVSDFPAITIARSTTNSGLSFTLGMSDFGGGGTDLLFDGVGASTGFGFRPRNSSGTQVNGLIIAPSGKVGIGTTSPNALLDLSGATASSSPILRFTGTGNASAGDVIGQIEFYNSDATDYTPGVMGKIRAIAGPSGGEGHIQILTDMPSEGTDANEVAIHVHSTGSVGIGTDTPLDKLYVQDGDIGINNTSGRRYRLISETGGGFTIRDQTAAAGRLSIDTSGRIQIGNNIPMWSGSYGGALVLKGNNATADRYAQLSIVDSAGTLLYDGLVVNNVGSVGIGETSPDRLFHVKRSDTGGTVAKFENSAGTVYIELNTNNQAGGDAGYLSYDSNQNLGLWTDDTQRITITSDGRIGVGEGAGNVGHRDVEGKMDLRMDMSGVNWVENDWASVWNSIGTPGANFNKAVLHLDTNRFGGSTGGIVGIAFSPGWQGHQNWGIYSHNRSGGSHSEGDLSFVNQLNAGNIQERFRIRADGLTVFPTGFASTPKTYEKAMARGFGNGVANQKCDLVLGTEFWGSLEVSITGTYSNQNMAGVLKRSYALGLNTSGTVYTNKSHTIQEEGDTADNFALGEVEYDSTLGRYKITIAHRVSTSNTLEVKIKAQLASGNQAYLEGLQNAYLTSVYTTNTTVYKKQTRESACHVYHTGGQSISATPVALSFTSTMYDPGDCFSGSEYTAPEDGVYSFAVTYLVYPHASGVTTMSWQKYSGGAWGQYGAGIQNGPSGQSHTLHSYPTLIPLAKGEKVRAMLAIGGFTGSPTMYGGQNAFIAHKI